MESRVIVRPNFAKPADFSHSFANDLLRFTGKIANKILKKISSDGAVFSPFAKHSVVDA
jgi:hypothetical protein